MYPHQAPRILAVAAALVSALAFAPTAQAAEDERSGKMLFGRAAIGFGWERFGRIAATNSGGAETVGRHAERGPETRSPGGSRPGGESA